VAKNFKKKTKKGLTGPTLLEMGGYGVGPLGDDLAFAQRVLNSPSFRPIFFAGGGVVSHDHLQD